MPVSRVVVPKSSFAPAVEPPKPPSLLPTSTPKKERRTFAPPEMWEDVDDAAEFHSDAYLELGIKESLPSNELTVGFIAWALELFWKDKGGKPKKGSPEWKRKVVAFAEKLKAELDAKAKKSNDSQSR